MAIGSKRLVVGAHYGLRDWLVQRITAIVLAVYTLFLVGMLLFARDPGYEGWARLFTPTWMKALTLIALASLFYHAWIGVRDIWMDYVKPTGVRLTLQVLTVLWLAACAVWSVQVLWRV
ncbi:succinate dehydrogenase, hydrophobic membrane anchor protein [Betaproteobacteria bacterium PRO7]|jgi:succinate dehydrogenase / fumarate reductase membrane anchor subunit|nr:succinate dehydrogenase, hydrophobic membrane anchor protein [Betaproteobacteria bacterium PRO7]GIL04435.1 MAG: succinate dehydrogenase, hydrophobic membrane anchor protein [Betaproteobacteria bacterium]